METALRALAAAGIRHALAGALAVGADGVPGATEDLVRAGADVRELRAFVAAHLPERLAELDGLVKAQESHDLLVS